LASLQNLAASKLVTMVRLLLLPLGCEQLQVWLLAS
jgi:hypothetical protein